MKQKIASLLFQNEEKNKSADALDIILKILMSLPLIFVYLYVQPRHPAWRSTLFNLILLLDVFYWNW